MKVVVVGLGSMGKRRVRNLLAIGLDAAQIFGIDVRADRRAEATEKYGITTFPSLEMAETLDPKAIVISTPPDQHLAVALWAVSLGCDMFIEASVLAAGLEDLDRRAQSAGLTIFPSCTMRFFPGPRGVLRHIESGRIGRVLTWQYQSGQYLPDWHPWESIHDFYVSNRETGGCREIVPFETVWLELAFGPIAQVKAFVSKRSDLDADIDDVYAVSTVHSNGCVGQFIVDVVSQPAVRHLRLTGSKGTLTWDDEAKVIRIFTPETGWVIESIDTGTVENLYINPEEPYIEEIRTFLRHVSDRTPPDYTLQDDIRVLTVLAQAEKSASSDD